MQKPPSFSVSRRETLRTLAAVAGAAVLPPLAFAEAQRLDPKDPSAVAAGYVENASQVDAKKFTNYERGQVCENCLLLQGAAGVAFRPCNFFQGKLVAAAGWCTAWTAEM